MPTSLVDLSQVSVLSEIVMRGGDLAHPMTRKSLKEQYARPNIHYPDLRVGLSCLFNPGASLDDLAREGSYRNAKLSVAIIQRLVAELKAVGCGLSLYVTPVPGYPHHHTLVIARGGISDLELRDDALDALIRAVTVVDNPYQSRLP